MRVLRVFKVSGVSVQVSGDQMSEVRGQKSEVRGQIKEFGLRPIGAGPTPLRPYGPEAEFLTPET